EALVGHEQLEPLAALQTGEDLGGDHGTLLQAGAAVGGGTDQGCAEALEGGTFDDAELFVQVLADLVELLLLDGQGAGIALDAVAGEDLHVDAGTLGAGRDRKSTRLNSSHVKI